MLNQRADRSLVGTDVDRDVGYALQLVRTRSILIAETERVRGIRCAPGGQAMGMTMISPGSWPGPWTYPDERYYYSWWDEVPPPPAPTSDRDIKALVVDQLKTNARTAESKINVDVKQGVVVLGGQVTSWLIKRAAGDDAWDTPGVVDVRNELEVVPPAA